MDLILSSSPQGKVNSPVDLLRLGLLPALESSITMCWGGMAGGSLYISFFCMTNRDLYAADVVGRPGLADAVVVFAALFFCADCFDSLSAASLKFFSNSSAVDIAVSHSSLVSEVRLWRLHALTVLVSILPIFVFSRIAMVIGCFLLFDSFCNADKMSFVLSAVGSEASTTSSMSDLAKPAYIFSCAAIVVDF